MKMHYVPDSFLTGCESNDRLEELKESRKAAPPIKFSEIKKVGGALNALKKSGRLGPYLAASFAFKTRNAFIDNYKPRSETELSEDALYLLEVDEKELRNSKKPPYLNLVLPPNYEITYESRECFNDKNFGGWIKCGGCIESVADVVESAILLDEVRDSGRRNLSDCIKEKKEELLDFTLQFAEISLLSETMKRIANQELTTVSNIIRRKYEDGRQIGGKDWEVETTRKIISKRINLRRLGLSDAADELDVRIVRGEDLIMPEPLLV